MVQSVRTGRYEDRGAGLSGYQVATSPTPQGPFTTTHTNVKMPGKGRVGDYNIFVDDDGRQGPPPPSLPSASPPPRRG